MKRIATVDDGRLGVASRNLLEAAKRHVLHITDSLDELSDVEPSELASVLTDPVLQRQFAQGMSVVALTDGRPSAAKLNEVKKFAEALGVSSPEVDVILRLADDHMTLFKLDFLRRSHIADMAKQQLAHEGFLGTLKGFASFRGVYEDAELAARYRALESMPHGSFGRAFFDYIRGNGFSFPGEKFGFPLAGIYHDFAHVLSGYSTDSAGEIQVGGFIAGFKTENPFFVILFVMLTFGAGVNVTPIEQPHVEKILETEGLADKFFSAVERGMAMKIDISDNWDAWPYFERPIEDVRAELGVPEMI
ncbi:MAG: hypothetical protein U0165_03090 [Polyangiaceae bacterium]